jgi:hypothetical protein
MVYKNSKNVFLLSVNLIRWGNNILLFFEYPKDTKNKKILISNATLIKEAQN